MRACLALFIFARVWSEAYYEAFIYVSRRFGALAFMQGSRNMNNFVNSKATVSSVDSYVNQAFFTKHQMDTFSEQVYVPKKLSSD